VKNQLVNFIASVREDRIGDIQDIARNLEGLGCKIENILTLSGVITGSASPGTSLSVLKIDGIKNIEPDRHIKASDH
jgi:hypothetical protein